MSETFITESHESTTGVPALSKNEVTAQLTEFVSAKFHVAEPQPADTLGDLHIDSLGAVQIAMRIKKLFGVELDNSDILGTTSLADIVSMALRSGRG